MANDIQRHDQSLIAAMAAQRKISPDVFLNTIRATCFPAGKASNEQLAAFLLVAERYGLDPFTKEIYAFPDKRSGGVIPIVGIDGWLNLANSNPAFDGIEIEDLNDADGNLVAVTARVWRKDRTHPTSITESLSECKQGTEPWRQRPRRMLRHKAAIQAIRYAFGFSGLHDEEEAREAVRVTAQPAIESAHGSPDALAERIKLRRKSVVIDTTPEPEPAPAAEPEQTEPDVWTAVERDAADAAARELMGEEGN